MSLFPFLTKTQSDLAYLPASSTFAHGRLTLTSLTPVTTTDAIGAGTIYYTPYIGEQIAIYDGTNWITKTFAEISIALAGLTGTNNYDVFAYVTGGNVTLFIGPSWASSISRGSGAGTTELTRQNGILVNANNISGGPSAKLGRYLGSFRATSSTTTEDSAGGTTTQVGGKRFLYNHYNRIPRSISVIDTTDTWSYATNIIRQANGAVGNRVEYLVGTSEVLIEAFVNGIVFLQSSNLVAAKVGVGIDATNAFSGLVQGGYQQNPSGIYAPIFGTFKGYPGLGYHALNWCESGADGTSIFLGDNGGDGQQAGMFAALMI